MSERASRTSVRKSIPQVGNSLNIGQLGLVEKAQVLKAPRMNKPIARQEKVECRTC